MMHRTRKFKELARGDKFIVTDPKVSSFPSFNTFHDEAILFVKTEEVDSTHVYEHHAASDKPNAAQTKDALPIAIHPETEVTRISV